MIIVSDYDRTLKIDGKISDNNLKAIKRFRELGNIFVINTGRSYQYFQKEMKNQSFSFDYAICGSGSQIVDNQFKLIDFTQINVEEITSLIDRIYESSALLFQFSSPNYYEVHKREDNTWNEPDFIESINTCACRFNTIEEASSFHSTIKCGEISAHLNYFSIDMTHKNTNKSNGIDRLIEQLSLDRSHIYVIGDGINDLPMIIKFNGYAVENAQDSVKIQAKGIFKEVADLIDYVIKEND